MIEFICQCRKPSSRNDVLIGPILLAVAQCKGGSSIPGVGICAVKQRGIAIMKSKPISPIYWHFVCYYVAKNCHRVLLSCQSLPAHWARIVNFRKKLSWPKDWKLWVSRERRRLLSPSLISSLSQRLIHTFLRLCTERGIRTSESVIMQSHCLWPLTTRPQNIQHTAIIFRCVLGL